MIQQSEKNLSQYNSQMSFNEPQSPADMQRPKSSIKNSPNSDDENQINIQ